MTRIVTTAYRYKRPAKKRKAVALEGPAIVRKRSRADAAVPPDEPEPAEPPPANDDSTPAPAPAAKRAIVTTTTGSPDDPEAASVNPTGGNKTAIVTARRPGARRVDMPDLTPEEYQRRGDAADALWRELVRRATSKDRP